MVYKRNKTIKKVIAIAFCLMWAISFSACAFVPSEKVVDEELRKYVWYERAGETDEESDAQLRRVMNLYGTWEVESLAKAEVISGGAATLDIIGKRLVINDSEDITFNGEGYHMTGIGVFPNDEYPDTWDYFRNYENTILWDIFAENGIKDIPAENNVVKINFSQDDKSQNKEFESRYFKIFIDDEGNVYFSAREWISVWGLYTLKRVED